MSASVHRISHPQVHGDAGSNTVAECWAPASARTSWLLLLAHYGFLPPGNECIMATVLGIADELTRDGFVLRYRIKGTDKVSLFCR